MRLSQLGQRRMVTVAYDDAEVKVVFKPAVINQEWLDRVTAIPDDGEEGSDTQVSLLALALVSWDVLDDDDQPMAPSEELLRRIPIDLRNAIMQAIMEALAPKK